MDEEEREARIASAFRDAAQGAPPAGFDAAQVVAASQRITRRRRSVLAGAALAVLAVAGVGVTAGLTGSSDGPTTASSVAQDRAAQDRAEQDRASQDRPGQNSDAGRVAAPAAPVPQIAAPGGSNPESASVAGAPLGPATAECADRQDPALRALVDQALPEVAGASEAMTTQECRPGGERGVALEVRDGERAGLLSVTYLPPGSTVRLAPGAQAAATASGGTVLVFTTPERDGDRPPFDDRIDAVVAYLAPRL
jgi:hypothetical protein